MLFWINTKKYRATSPLHHFTTSPHQNMPIKRQTKPRKYGAATRATARRGAIAAMISNRATAIRGTKSVRRQLAIVRLYKKEALALVAKQDAAEVESDLWAVLP